MLLPDGTPKTKNHQSQAQTCCSSALLQLTLAGHVAVEPLTPPRCANTQNNAQACLQPLSPHGCEVSCEPCSGQTPVPLSGCGLRWCGPCSPRRSRAGSTSPARGVRSASASRRCVRLGGMNDKRRGVRKRWKTSNKREKLG